MPRLVEPRLRRGATGAWKTLRVSHPAHSPDDQHGDISIELTEGTFLKSFDRLCIPASIAAGTKRREIHRMAGSFRARARGLPGVYGPLVRGSRWSWWGG